jgi:hypothetical protein
LIRVHVFDAGRRFAAHRTLLDAIVEQAVRHVSDQSGLTEVDLVIQPIDGTAGGFPIQASTSDGHSIHIGLDPTFLDDRDVDDELLRTVVHELHHALRWRYVRKWTVAEVVALEGLALAADRAVCRDVVEVDEPPAEEAEKLIAYLAAHGEEAALQHRTWLYSSDPARPGDPGRVYRAGQLLMDAALAALDKTPWQAVRRSGLELVEEGARALNEGRGPARREPPDGELAAE